MRWIFIALFTALAVLWEGICFANTEQPKHLRVCVQLIEVPHPTLTKLLQGGETNGSVLHATAIALAKNGEGRLLDTAMVACRSGQKGTLGSIAEFIYPTEYNPTCVGLFGPLPVVQRPRTSPLRPFPFTAFDTRNTGVSLEVEPTLGDNDQIIDLRMLPEWVRLDRFDTVMEHRDKWGDASLRMPVFETWRANISVTLMAGKFELVSVITPKQQEPAPVVLRKLLLFVRADVIRTGN